MKTKNFKREIPSKTLACLGYAYAAIDASVSEQILALLNDLETDGASHAYARAVIHAGLDQKEAAFKCLKTALEHSDQSVTVVKVDPRLDSLRSDLRFAELLRRIRLQ